MSEEATKTTTTLGIATIRELRVRYPEAADDAITTLAADLVARRAVSFDGDSKLRVFDVDHVERQAPRLLSLNGPIAGHDDRAKTARAHRRELELEPLKVAPVARTTGRSLTEALSLVAQMPARTETERCARAYAREQVLEAYSLNDGPGAA